MNFKLIWLPAAFALCIAAGCRKNEMAGQPETGSPVMVCVNASTESSDTKVTFGSPYEEAGKKCFEASWDASGEVLNISEFIDDARSQDKSTTSYSRSSAHSASFSTSLDSKTTSGRYDYVAVYPQSAARTTGTAAAKKGRASFALAPTLAQKPSASSPDPASIIMTAVDKGHSAQVKTLSFAFSYQTAFSRMTVKNFPALSSGETLTSIKISAPGKKLSGRYWYDYAADSCVEYEGSMENYVLIDPQAVSVNSTSFDLWWTSLPASFASGDEIILEATTSRGNTLKSRALLSASLELKKGIVATYIYDWTKYEDLVLKFDFSTWPSTWPTTLESGSTYKYGDYSFTHYGFNNSTGQTKNRISYNATSKFMTLNYGGFLSLPVLKDRKLVGVSINHGASKSSSRNGGVVYGVRSFCDSVEYVSANGKSGDIWNVEPGSVVKLDILTTFPEHQYYLTCTKGGIGVSSLELTYAYSGKVDPSSEADAFTVGNLNIWMPSARTGKKEAGTAAPEREWEYARYNIRDIIKDNAFDILGVQEATLRVRNDIKTDLSSTNTYNYQYFLHKPAEADVSSSVGIVYNKKRFSLSDTHQFWLSTTPDVPASYDPAEGMPRSAGCAVMTDLKTGRKYFVMVVHASLDDPTNARDGELILSRIAQYNTSVFPVILIGDMNAFWSMPLYYSLSSILEDSRYAVELDRSELMNPGTYNGPGGSAEYLKDRDRRIDFVFVKDCKVYSYKVSRTQYKAGSTVQYPSDHCPPVVRVI